MSEHVNSIASDPTRSNAQKVDDLEALIAEMKQRASDDDVPLESQHGHALVAANEALIRLKAMS
jgi:hypothetical protein